MSAHRPENIDLLRDGFVRYAGSAWLPHHVPTDDLRADLVGGPTSLRTAIVLEAIVQIPLDSAK